MNMQPGARQHGFVLITSLIFLVVVTLIAVSAINSSTLQEKIATNTRARETATQYANAALREAETLLEEYVDVYSEVGSDAQLEGVPDSNSATTPTDIRIWAEYGMMPAPTTDPDELPTGCEADTDSSRNFVTCRGIWAKQGSDAPNDYITNAGDPPLAHYYVEELDGCYQADLNPDACATGRVVIYRITARATYGNAAVVTQSTFEKYY